MRTFIAIEVPYTGEIRELQKAINRSGRVKLVEPENVHLTLKFLGEIDKSKLPEIMNGVGACKIPEFQIRLKGIGFFPNEHYVKVVWIGVDDGGSASSLMRCIDTHLVPAGFKREKSYVPHITVARVKGRIDVESLARFRNTCFGEFVAKEIKIKKSILTEKGPVYEDIGVIPLR
ncbi:MAG: RNA 2',3'-cyclic phosphodiesterase [Euryarchaeota archaeon]|nr:RNA 2',3'-cyclic phosphodiesterase [Euryarchaeota archaeon]